MQDKRRELLKALTLGGGAVAATQLPTSWTKPVVDSVTLPVHAQTTCSPDTIPGITVTCASQTESFWYTIRSSDSSCGFEVSFNDTLPSPPYIRFDQSTSGGFASISLESVELNSSVQGTRNAFVNCQDANSSGTDSFPILAQDETGRSYRLDGQFSIDPTGPSVSMSVLTITPV